MKYAIRLSLALLLTFQPGFSHAQTVKADSVRKVTIRIIPEYPPIARARRLSGIVKLEAVVAPNGIAQSVAVIGGAPILSVAAATAVREWKWKPAPTETTEFIAITFESD